MNRTRQTSVSVMSLLIYCALLGIAVAPAAIAVAWIANGQISPNTVFNAAVGGGICWLAGALALTITFLGNYFHAPVQGLLVSMLVRMGLPLAAIIALPKLSGPLAATSMTTTILGVYLVALIVETGLSLRMVPPQSRVPSAA